MEARTKVWTQSLDRSYEKLPALPKGADEFIVSVLPWLALIFGVISILSGVSVFGIGSLSTPYAALYGPGGYTAFVIAGIILLAEGILMLLAFPKLRRKEVRGWNLMFWVLVLSIVSSLVSLSVFGIVWAVIGALIGYYFLYQIKSYYK